MDKIKEIIKQTFFGNNPPTNLPTKATILTYKNKFITSIEGVNLPKLDRKNTLIIVKITKTIYKIVEKLNGL